MTRVRVSPKPQNTHAEINSTRTSQHMRSRTIPQSQFPDGKCLISMITEWFVGEAKDKARTTANRAQILA
jgi:hypothetical protein